MERRFFLKSLVASVAAVAVPLQALLPRLSFGQHSVSGTSVDFSDLPSGVKRLTIKFDGISITGGETLRISVK